MMNHRLVAVVLCGLLLLPLTASSQTPSRRQPPKPVKPHTSPATTRQGASSAARPYRLVSPDGDFTLEFPTKPERQADREVAGSTVRDYWLITDSIAFAFSYSDTEYGARDREGNRLPLTYRRDRLDWVQGEGWAVLRSEWLAVNMYEQEMWMPSRIDPSDKRHFVERSTLRYGRLYLMNYSCPVLNRKLDLAACHRFFDSLHVTKEPQPR